MSLAKSPTYQDLSIQDFIKIAYIYLMLLFVCYESIDCFLRYDPYKVQQAIFQDTI